MNRVHSGPCSQGEGGRIEDMGDLCVTTGKTLIDGADWPGLRAWKNCLPATDVSPKKVPDAVSRLASFWPLASRRSSVASRFVPEAAEHRGTWTNCSRESGDLPINLGWVAASCREHDSEEIQAAAQSLLFLVGILGVSG